MKTLVIHPYDETTQFLSPIYLNKDWTIINHNPSKKELREGIKSHDRIIMLGHGCKAGLYGYNYLVIDSTYVQFLRGKHCVAVWCNANEFVEKYRLTGFYTGMIISEIDESYSYCVKCTYGDIEESNKLFSDALSSSIDSYNMVDSVLLKYKTVLNPIIKFNRNNIFSNY